MDFVEVGLSLSSLVGITEGIDVDVDVDDDDDAIEKEAEREDDDDDDDDDEGITKEEDKKSGREATACNEVIFSSLPSFSSSFFGQSLNSFTSVVVVVVVVVVAVVAVVDTNMGEVVVKTLPFIHRMSNSFTAFHFVWFWRENVGILFNDRRSERE